MYSCPIISEPHFSGALDSPYFNQKKKLRTLVISVGILENLRTKKWLLTSWNIIPLPEKSDIWTVLSSTTAADFTLSDHTTPAWEEETLQVCHNPAHEWWFAKEMREDDVLLIKMFDSEGEKPGSKTAICEST